MISDWEMIGLTLIILGIVGFCGWALFEIAKHTAPVVLPRVTVENLFIMSEIIILISLTGMTATLEKKEASKKFTSIGVIVFQGLVLVLPYIMYSFFSSFGSMWSLNPWPDVLPVLIGFEILNILTVPFVVAYARCRE